ncbi:MAG TPA: SUF system NifU family Fe-S cluster assembly protein [Rectinemataceae bacterium]|nr:SUF system NifU family Fe-S cluster assembly protein [Rectinemataceae bacterium]
MSGFDELYQDIIMDHYRRPRGRADLSHIPEDRVMENPTCGDSIKLEVQKDGEGRIVEIRHQGQGCAISTASASLMTEFARGMSGEEARAAAARFVAALRGDSSLDELDAMGDLAALRGVAGLPVRVKCATLPWHALIRALEAEA